MIDEDKIARRYAGIGLMLIIVLWLMSILVATLRPEWQLMSPIWVSTGFSLIFLLGFAVLWKWVVRKHKDSVTTLYSVVSGFRMLMALFTLFIVGRAAMLPYVLVFMIFYLVMVAYHSIYFSRITNRQ